MGDEVPNESAESVVSEKSVERLFPFVVKTRGLLVGRDTLRANKSKLHFVLITTDIADSSRVEVLNDFSFYPVVQHFTGTDFERFFAVKGAKAIGFTKSGLAQSIYAELKSFRLNKPPNVPTPPKPKVVKAPVAPITPSENP